MAKATDKAAAKPPADDITPADLGEPAAPPDPKDAEIDRLRAELAAAKSGGVVYPPGKRYRVALKDAPSVVVEPQPGEHPWDAYKRVVGVQSSQNTPVITETDEPAWVHPTQKPAA